MNLKIPIETSARHIHISEQHFKVLFGPDKNMTPVKKLSQPGQYACRKRITIVGPKGQLEHVVILGPYRSQTQIELSVTDTRLLGINSIIRQSGDIEDTPGCILLGPHGKVELKKGVIVAKRHIRMTPQEAEIADVKDNDSEFVITTSYERSLIFSDVIIRVDPNFRLAMHVDTDEANAFANEEHPHGIILKVLNGYNTFTLQNWVNELEAGIVP